MYTVKQLADLACVSRRTLHYYDEIGLLQPVNIAGNGYRYYNRHSLLRLQQILLYREMGLELSKIKDILDAPQFDILSALQSHRKGLHKKIRRFQTLIETIDTTIMDITGEITMSKENMFNGFDDEQQKIYEKEAVDNWGETARDSIRLWNSYSKEKQSEILQESGDIYRKIAENMDKGVDSPEIREFLKLWHRNLCYYYEPTLEVMSGLGNMYNDHPDFHANFSKIHPDLPAFLKEAVALYVDELEIK